MPSAVHFTRCVHTSGAAGQQGDNVGKAEIDQTGNKYSVQAYD